MHSDAFMPRERRGMAEYLAARKTVFLVAYLGYAFCYLVRNNLKLASASMADSLNLTPIQIGIILASFTVAYAPGKVLMGILVDRTSMKTMLVGCVGISAVICAAIPLARSFPLLVALMIALGIVQGAGAPAALAMVGSWYPNKTRGAAVSAWNTSQNLGAGVLAALAAVILVWFPSDWRLIFWIPAGICAALTLWLAKFAQNRPWQEGYPTLPMMYGRSGVPRSEVENQDSYWRLLWSAFTSSPVLLVLLVLNALLNLLRFGVINWITFYLPDDKGLTISHAQNLFAVLEITAIPMVVLFAFLAFKWPASMSKVGFISMLALSATLVVYALAGSGTFALIAALLLGGLIYAPQVIVNILTVNLLPPRIIGAAVGAVGLSGYLVGEVLANLVIPVAAEALGWDAIYLGLAVVALVTAGVYSWLRPYERRSVVLH